MLFFLGIDFFPVGPHQCLPQQIQEFIWILYLDLARFFTDHTKAAVLFYWLLSESFGLDLERKFGAEDPLGSHRNASVHWGKKKTPFWGANGSGMCWVMNWGFGGWAAVTCPGDNIQLLSRCKKEIPVFCWGLCHGAECIHPWEWGWISWEVSRALLFWSHWEKV